MKTINFLLIVFVISACNQKHQQNSLDKETQGDPILQINKIVHSFGEIESGEILRYSFQLSNEGTGILHFDSASADCSCTSIIFDKMTLAADEKTYMTVVFDSRGEWGKVYKGIKIHHNGQKQVKDLYISATVNHPLLNK